MKHNVVCCTAEQRMCCDVDIWREWLHGGRTVRLEGVAARCSHGAHSNETLSHVLVLADQFLPICHLMIQLRDFESKLRDVGFQQET